MGATAIPCDTLYCSDNLKLSAHQNYPGAADFKFQLALVTLNLTFLSKNGLSVLRARGNISTNFEVYRTFRSGLIQKEMVRRDGDLYNKFCLVSVLTYLAMNCWQQRGTALKSPLTTLICTSPTSATWTLLTSWMKSAEARSLIELRRHRFVIGATLMPFTVAILRMTMYNKN